MQISNIDSTRTIRELNATIDTLRQENAGLQRELIRNYEQLNLVFEITDDIAKLTDPIIIQDTVIRRFGALIGAAAIFVDSARGQAMHLLDSAGGEIPGINTRRIDRALGAEIAAVRSHGHACVPTIKGRAKTLLRGAAVLLGAMRHGNARPTVVAALRPASHTPYDSSDMRLAESILGYGGMIATNAIMVRDLSKTAFETVCALANAIDAKDNYTLGHSERVGWLARVTGDRLGMSPLDVERLEWAGLLHDVGKIGIAEHILNKPGKLTDEELEIIRRHPRLSFEVLRPVASLQPVLEAVLHHHENWDGSGYPFGLAGECIPLGARIIHAVDIFDALTSARPYRAPYSVEAALGMIRAGAGSETDPTVVRAFIRGLFHHAMHNRDHFDARFAHLVWEDRHVACSEAIALEEAAPA
jgi:HD-GYP domain-containing protein (c-di-GMP phosphodiesterase class II)